MADLSREPSKAYLNSVLFLIIAMALFELVNGALNIALLFSQDEAAKDRAKVTRQVVIVVGSCLVELPRPTDQKAVEHCVDERLGKLNE